MKTIPFVSVIRRWMCLGSLAAAAGMSVSCMTTYDAYGRPVQSVDPVVAVAGAAAVGLATYAIANNENHHNNNYHGGGSPSYSHSTSYNTYRHGGGYRPPCRPGYYQRPSYRYSPPPCRPYRPAYHRPAHNGSSYSASYSYSSYGGY